VTRPLRLALLGCGYAARLNGGALRTLGTGVECFYASRDPARAAAFCRALGGRGTFPSYEAALQSTHIDGVLVLTPPDQHLEWTLRALEAGKHVVVEKPPFLHASDFDAVYAASRRASRRVMVAENYYYKPLARTLRKLIGEGVVGDVRFVYVNALKQQRVEGWRTDVARAGGGALFEGGIHWVNLMANLGLEVRAARGAAPAAERPERSLLALFEYHAGAVGALYHSWEIPSPLRGLRVSRIYGSRGSIAFESNGLLVIVWGVRKRMLLPGLRDLTGRQAMWRDFVKAMNANEEPEFDLARARRDMQLIESIYASLNGDAA
jgi:UDP-N-acetylglucosamine 3-dehydrogenase